MTYNNPRLGEPHGHGADRISRAELEEFVTSEHTLDVLDGVLCPVCLTGTGDMIPWATGPHGQLFKHPSCELPDLLANP